MEEKRKKTVIAKTEIKETKKGGSYLYVIDEDDDHYSAWMDKPGIKDCDDGAVGTIYFHFEEVGDKKYRRIDKFVVQPALPLNEIVEDLEGKDKLVVRLKSIGVEISKIVAELEG